MSTDANKTTTTTWGANKTTTGTSWNQNKTTGTATQWGRSNVAQAEQPVGWAGGSDNVTNWNTQKGTSGGWKKKQQEEQKTSGFTSSTTNKTGFGGRAGGFGAGEPGTAWGALKRRIDEKNNQGRGMGTGSSFGASRGGFGQNKGFGQSSGFGQKSGFGSTGGFGAKTGTGTGFGGTGFGSTTSSSTYGSFGAKTGTTGAFGTTGGTGFKSSGTTYGTTGGFGGSTWGAKGYGAKTTQIPVDYKTTRGQPFLHWEFQMENANRELVTWFIKHIAAIPRFNPYPVEMLRWFDYIIGGGINLQNLKPADPNAKTTTFGTGTNTYKAGTTMGVQKEYVPVTPWSVPLNFMEHGKLPEEIPQPYGALPASTLPQEPPPFKVEEEEEIKVTARGFYKTNKLFQKMQEYTGGSHTPGLRQLTRYTDV